MTTPPDPVAVILAMNDLCNAGDLEGVLALFADDAVLRNLPPPDPPETGLLNGIQEIRAWFAPQIQHHLHVISENYQTAGDTVTWDTTVSEDTFREAGIESFEVMAEATVKNGKITFFSITPTPESLRNFAEAEGEAGTSP
jgi:ketosteroid isomerase-like protein